MVTLEVYSPTMWIASIVVCRAERTLNHLICHDKIQSMFWKKLNILLFLLFAGGILFCAYGQSQSVNAQEFPGLNNQPLREKVFAHTDKNFYLAGEILWFKLYDVSADSLKPIDLSNVAYVEILNANEKPVLQATVALDNGRGNGSFYLPSSITSGNYIFRAYTNWMKNFGADQYFQKDITIVNTLTKLATPAMVFPAEPPDASLPGPMIA